MKKIILVGLLFMFGLHSYSQQTPKQKAAHVKKQTSKNNSEIKSGARQTWKGIKKTGKGVGHTGKRVVKTIGHGTKKIVKEVGNDVKNK